MPVEGSEDILWVGSMKLFHSRAVRAHPARSIVGNDMGWDAMGCDGMRGLGLGATTERVINATETHRANSSLYVFSR